MQPGAGSGAGSGNITRVLWNFGFYQYDIEGWQKNRLLFIATLLCQYAPELPENHSIIRENGGKLMNVVSILKLLLLYGRFNYMMKNTMNVVKGVGLGMIAGATVAVVGERMMKTDKKQMKKNAGKAIRAMGEVIDGVQYMFK